MWDKAFLIYSALRYWYNDPQFCLVGDVLYIIRTAVGERSKERGSFKIRNFLQLDYHLCFPIANEWRPPPPTTSTNNNMINGILACILIASSRDMGAGRYWEGGKERVELLCLGRPSNWFYYKVTPCLPPVTTALNDREMGGSHS